MQVKKNKNNFINCSSFCYNINNKPTQNIFLTARKIILKKVKNILQVCNAA